MKKAKKANNLFVKAKKVYPMLKILHLSRLIDRQMINAKNIDQLSNTIKSAKGIYGNDIEIDSKIAFTSKKIECDEISVVLQGAIDKRITRWSIKSIRYYLPGAYIILSTWKGSNVDDLDYDEIIYNIDPGYSFYVFENGTTKQQNINRQLVTIKNGLERVKTKYVLKLRTDTILTGNKFLDYFEVFTKRTSLFRLFDQRILIYDYLTSRAGFADSTELEDWLQPPFFISDFFYFALTNDLKKLVMDTPLMDLSYYTNFTRPERLKVYKYKHTQRYLAQIYMHYTSFNNYFKDVVDFKDSTDFNDQMTKISMQFTLNNFVPLSFLQSDIICIKHKINLFRSINKKSILSVKGFLRYEDFLKYYRDLDPVLKTSGIH